MTEASTSGPDRSAETPLAIAGRFLDSAPVDLLSMAETLGLQVNMDADLPDEISGCIMRGGNGDSGYRIEINRLHSFNRKRFTLAHEISHYLLHKEQIGDGIRDNVMYRSRLSDFMEIEANQNAARMLMPAPLVRRVYHAGLRWLAGLSQAFQVSEEAMRIRLKQLGLAP
jgi:hypothetical protein